MSRTPNLPGASLRREVFSSAAETPLSLASSSPAPRPWRLRLRRLALPLAGLLFAAAAHAVPQVSSLVHAPDILPAGGTVTSTVTIAETDSLAIGAPGASFTYSIPANTIYMGMEPVPVGTCTSTVTVGNAGPGSLTCSGITLAAAQSHDFKVLLRTTVQGTLSVKAQIDGGTSSETKIITVNQGADVGVSIATPATAPSGSTVPISFTLVNNGPDASSGSKLTYSIPTGLALTGALPSGCTASTAELTCNVASLAVNGTRVITVNGVIGAESGSTITHQPSISPAGAIGDGVSANNNATANTVVTPGYVLALSKTHNGGQLLVGQQFDFVLNPSFSGGTAPTGVTLSDTIPANFTIRASIDAATGWTCTVAGQTVNCTRSDIGGGGTNVGLGTISIPVTAVSAGTGVVNQATVSATGPIANSASASVPADVAVSATDFRADKRRSWPQDNVPLGQAFDYQVGSTNLGSTRLLAGSTIQLVDNMPAGVQINSVTQRDGYTCTVTKGGATVTPTPGTPVAGPATITCLRTLTADIGVDTSNGSGARNGGYVIVNATIPAATGGQIVNSMCVNVALPAAAPTSGADPDANTGNDCVSLGTGSNDGATAADVRVLKRVVGIGNAPGNRQIAGQDVTWQIEVVNAGPSEAQNVVVTDTFAQVIGAGNVSQTPNGGTFAGTCALPANGGGFGAASLSGCTLSTLPVCRASTDAPSALPLCPVIQVVAKHYGDGASATDHGFQIANTARAVAATPADPDLANNDGSTTAYLLARTDVTVTKAASKTLSEPVPVGQELVYTLTASNRNVPQSLSRAYSVSVTDTLPANLMFLDAVASGGGNCSSFPVKTQPTGTGTTNNQLVCSWNSLDRSVQQTVTVRVRPLYALLGQTITNNVVVKTATPELDENNNAASATTAVSAPKYDLVVTKHDDVDPVNVGDDVGYTITVSNNAASTAEGVRLLDLLPLALPTGEAPPTFVSATAPEGIAVTSPAVGASGGQVKFTIPLLGGSGPGSTGESSSLQFRVVLKGVSRGTFQNNAKVDFDVAAQNAYDINLENNSVAESTAFRYKADVQVVSKAAVSTGTTTPLATASTTQTFDWLVSLRNNGPDPAETTTFTDTLPAPLVLAGTPVFTVTGGSFTPAAPTCTGAAGSTAVSCAITSMPANGTATVRIPVRFSGAAPANGTVLTNRAHIVTTGSADTVGGTDPDGGNNFNDGQVTVQNSALSGRVYEDLNGNGTIDATESGIAGVTMQLSGTDSLGNAVTRTTTTDANGRWSFTVQAGTYSVIEIQPAGYLPGITKAGTVSVGSTHGTVPPGASNGPNGSNANRIDNIVLVMGGTSVDNNFGEVRAASLAGRVYQDADYNDVSSAGDPGIAGVTVTLTGLDMFGNPVSLTTTTAASTGNYAFSNLTPGSYTLSETQPAAFADGRDAAGTEGGTVGNDMVSAIALASGKAGTGYDFGELLTRIPVFVFSDVNNNAKADAGETGIVAVTLRLTGTDAAGNAVSIVAVPTSTPGGYEFRNVPPSGASGYTVTETQPPGYAPGQASSNGHPGTVQAGGNVITGVTVSGSPVPLEQGEYLFGELLPAGISGRVYYDRDGNGAQGAPATEPGIAGVTITLTGNDVNRQPVSRTTTTDANGDYRFDDIGAGTYTVTETRPAGYQPGLTHAGTVSGTGSARGTVPTTGTGVSSGPNGSTANVIRDIVLGVGVADAGSTGNNFSAVKPASLSGYVYADVAPSNGTRDSGEPGIGGTTVRVTGTDFLGNAVTYTVQTTADGRYLVDALTPGTYQIDETQPAGMADGPESLGTVGGAPRGTANPGGTNDRFGGLALVSEDAGIDYNFGERGGQIGGWVYVDTNNDGIRQPTETGIAGVTITLTGRTAGGLAVNATAVTDASGRYVFTGLLPADAAGYTLRETQPATYADGLDAVGTLDGTPSGTLGNDVLSAIAYRGGNGDNYNFGERGASLAGTVYNDANRNGTREPQDLPIAGVTITLTGTDAAGQPVTRTAVTDTNGRYELPGLPLPGSGGYTLTETQPAGYDEGIAVPGTLGGTAAGPNQIRVTFTGLDANGTGYDFNEHSNQPASLTGTVWFDQNHNRTRESGEGQGEGWTVELLRCADGGNACPETAATVLYTVATGADGSYRFGDLVPGEYRVRFRSPDGRVVGGVWPTDPAQNGAGGPYPTPAASDPRFTIKVRVNPGANVQKQDLPYDPGGVVYDSVSGTPVPGAVVRLVGPGGFDPAQHLLDGRDSYTTGPNGYYDFFVLPGAPAGEYRLIVTPPGAYLPSSMYPAAAGALGTQSCAAPANGPAPAQSNPCVVSPGAALVTGAGYYLVFQMPGGGGMHVVANNIPLDPSDATLIELRKTTSKLTVKKGELLPYRITARNTRGNAVPGVAVVDTLPPGFRYIQGSLTVRTLPGGVALPVVPQISGRQVVVPGQDFAPNETKEYLMVAGVGVGVGEGEFVNQVVALQGVGGRTLSNLATATVRVVPDALFDCTDVIGKVYDDRNANGYQDDGEPGLANVRIATVNGVLATTDAEGRYHIACAAIPKEGTGSNLVLKLDERTLPSGYRTTSENPAAERATRGKVLKINFGATVHRVVRLALQGAAFDDGAATLRAGFAGELDRTVAVLAEKTSVLRLAYKAAPGEPASLGRQRTDAVKAAVLARWKQLGEQRAARNEAPLFNLDIEVELVPAQAASEEAKP